MIKVQLANKIRWAFAKKEELGVKILILVGGRNSTKSTAAADVTLAYVSTGQRWACGREFLNSIDDSCQALLAEEIDRIGLEGFDIQARCISHISGGEIFHKGLSRNPESIKSIVADGIWIEEGEKLSQKTIEVLSASFRISAAKRARAERMGVEASIPNLIITMNRGSSKDPVSKAFLKPAENDIAKQGYYHDEDVLIVEVNYTDIPKSWVLGSGLEPERLRDKRLMSTAEYDHKWHGKYNDSIENSIIKAEWFDACVDAHKKLGIKPMGQERVAFDPSDVGDDPEALAHMHGIILTQAMQSDARDIEDATDWAAGYANERKVDKFIWDCDGMGIGLKRQIRDAFSGKKIDFHQFKGSEGAWMPNEIYQAHEDEAKKDTKTNHDAFANQRAQWYWELRRRMLNTWIAITKNRHFAPDELISFSSDIIHLDILRSEICRIPRKYIASGRIQLMTKADMVARDISSPNIADCVMMLMKPCEEKSEEPTRLPPMRRWGS